jgi:hypothetical protein
MQNEITTSTRPTFNKISAPESANTQRGRILRLLIDARGGWVPSPEIAAMAQQYNSRLLELRRLNFRIENRTEEVDGVRRSWFRLIPGPVQVEPATPPAADHVIPVNPQTRSAGAATSDPAQELLPFGDPRHG